MGDDLRGKTGVSRLQGSEVKGGFRPVPWEKPSGWRKAMATSTGVAIGRDQEDAGARRV